MEFLLNIWSEAVIYYIINMIKTSLKYLYFHNCYESIFIEDNWEVHVQLRTSYTFTAFSEISSYFTKNIKFLKIETTSLKALEFSLKFLICVTPCIYDKMRALRTYFHMWEFLTLFFFLKFAKCLLQDPVQ